MCGAFRAMPIKQLQSEPIEKQSEWITYAFWNVHLIVLLQNVKTWSYPIVNKIVQSQKSPISPILHTPSAALPAIVLIPVATEIASCLFFSLLLSLLQNIYDIRVIFLKKKWITLCLCSYVVLPSEEPRFLRKILILISNSQVHLWGFHLTLTLLVLLYLSSNTQAHCSFRAFFVCPCGIDLSRLGFPLER